MPSSVLAFQAEDAAIWRWAALWFAAAAGLALLLPLGFWLLLAGTGACGALFLVYRHPVGSCAGWLLIAGATPEMFLGDLLGEAAYQPIIALVKAAGLLLGLVCILRFGPAFDRFNPAFAYLFIFASGMTLGLHPDLTAADSLRSLVGSVAPFAFCFARLPRHWAQSVIRMTIWIPTLTIAAGCVLQIAGVRPLFVDSGGWRLAALGHPAFLGGFCLTAIYACLVELLRQGRRRDLALLLANGMWLVATGARAPVFYATTVGLLVFLFARSAAFPWRRRLPLLLGLGALLPLALLAAFALPDVRLFNLLAGEAGNLSGRDLLWPLFERAADAAPWFGWGLGAGNVIIPPDSETALLIGSRAAHNEYLRMAVEGGMVGRAILVGLFTLWAARHTALLPRAEKWVLRLVFIAFAAHAGTDNLLISTSACVFFGFIAAVFARGARETEARADAFHRMAHPSHACGPMPNGAVPIG